ncbi:hypothetical protein BKA63DRAFT_587575 [Paraphoma chrysanthemicola]|nr:hypothetical protein BKA63DRAFT_587575 [Paraphoma chrysanthemicola]
MTTHYKRSVFVHRMPLQLRYLHKLEMHTDMERFVSDRLMVASQLQRRFGRLLRHVLGVPVAPSPPCDPPPLLRSAISIDSSHAVASAVLTHNTMGDAAIFFRNAWSMNRHCPIRDNISTRCIRSLRPVASGSERCAYQSENGRSGCHEPLKAPCTASRPAPAVPTRQTKRTSTRRPTLALGSKNGLPKGRISNQNGIKSGLLTGTEAKDQHEAVVRNMELSSITKQRHGFALDAGEARAEHVARLSVASGRSERTESRHASEALFDPLPV